MTSRQAGFRKVAMVSSSEEWVIRGTIESDLFPELTFTPIMKTLMKLRGLRDPGEVIDYLYPSLGNLRDPRDMRGMLPACERTACAIETGETIGVFTDYDVDGVCSAALLHRFFLRIGAPSPVVFIPDRTRDGYGLNARGIAALHAQGVSLLITADCGSNAYDEVEQAKELGIDVIITDHHEPGQHLPRALALINPKQPGCPFGDEDLCGAGVVFHFIVALRAVLRERGWKELPNLRQDLDLVAMATVADVVALSGINRILVKEGLAVLNTSEGVGLPVLARVAGIHHEVYAKDIGFILGPRINAAGRVASAERALDLLITEDERTAYGIANELHLLNRRRQATEQRVLREALAMIGEGDHTGSVIVAAGTDWHLGVIGIVASRLASLFDRPAIVITITDGVGKGSGRSVAGIDLHAALSEVSAHLLAFGSAFGSQAPWASSAPAWHPRHAAFIVPPALAEPTWWAKWHEEQSGARCSPRARAVP